MATMRVHSLLYSLPLILTSAMTLAQSGDGGQASGNVPASASSGDIAGAAGPSTGAVSLSTGATVAIAVVVSIVVILGISTAVLFYLAKKRQWDMKEKLRQSRRRIASGIKTVMSPLTPHRTTFSPPHEFVKAYAAHLKRSGKLELPEWTDIVKTGKLKELAPYDPDWYYIRAASMARKIYLRGGIGVGGFRRIYGGNQRNGSRPRHFCKSSGSVARHILQQLQTMNIIDFDPKGGRRITSNGQRDLDQVAGRITAAN